MIACEGDCLGTHTPACAGFEKSAGRCRGATTVAAEPLLSPCEGESLGTHTPACAGFEKSAGRGRGATTVAAEPLMVSCEGDNPARTVSAV